MRRHARCAAALHLRRGDGRVVQEAQLVVVAGVVLEERRLILQSDAEGEGMQDGGGDVVARLVEGGGVLSEAGECDFRQPDVRLLVVLLASDFIALSALLDLGGWAAGRPAGIVGLGLLDLL